MISLLNKLNKINSFIFHSFACFRKLHNSIADKIHTNSDWNNLYLYTNFHFSS